MHDLMGNEEIELQRRILKSGFKLVYEPNAIVIHLIDEKRLTKLWFLERSFWQGYSEIMGIRGSKRFNELLGSERESLKYFTPIKFMEYMFELIGSTTLEKEIEKAKRLGRLAAISSMIRK